MRETPESWASRLAADPLPPMRRTLTRVRDLLDTPRASHTALSGLIGSDPGFALHIFSQLGSLPSQPRQPVTKLENAIPLLGMHAIEQAARTLPSLEDRLTGPARRGLLSCYSQAAHAAIYASALAQTGNGLDPQGYASAALLHDLGEMSLWLAEPELMRSIKQHLQQGVERDQAVQQALGFTLEALDQALGRHWGLPEPIQAAQDLSNSHLRQPLLVMLASAVARCSSLGWEHRETNEIIGLLADLHALPQPCMQARMHGLAAEAARQLQGLSLPLPAFRLPFTASVPLRKPSQAKPVAEAVKTPKPPPQAVTPARPPVRSAPQPQPKPRIKPKAPANPLQEKLLLTIKEMKAGQGLNNIMFAMLSTDRKQLKARYVVEQSEQPRLKGFEVDLGQPGLFAALMKKPQAFWLNAGNLVKYLPMIPEQQLQNLNARSFVSMSLFIREKPFGLIYADNGNDNLTPEQFANFKVLCQRFVKQIA
jgi:HD-like signal output (HDOD) protein